MTSVPSLTGTNWEGEGDGGGGEGGGGEGGGGDGDGGDGGDGGGDGGAGDEEPPPHAQHIALDVKSLSSYEPHHSRCWGGAYHPQPSPAESFAPPAVSAQDGGGEGGGGGSDGSHRVHAAPLAKSEAVESGQRDGSRT